ncbi:DUF4344 domain-containing metallopeptidase [Streptomyces sp. NPDC053560]|uniref:DUF4344 domain-containing metallopeptidase n=1 Tax=Streptomyces sp. NPDC053560 TaxID=3365711 RepID=UPI0037D55181
MTGKHAAPKARSRRSGALRRTVLTTTALTGLSATLVAAAPGWADSGRAAAGHAAAPARGLVPQYLKPGRGDADERAFLQRNRLLERVSGKLNGRLDIPAKIRMTGRSCGNSDIAYDPEKGRIDVCYEFVAEVRDMFKDARYGRVGERTAGVVSETLYHESAHALIDKLRLPFTGHEEDAADQFAAYNLIPQGAKGQRSLLAAAENYDLYARQEAGHVDFSDEHSPSAARAANYRSYLYGAAPKRWAALVDGKHLTRSRSEYSREEYQDLRTGWSHLLRPHLR